MAETTLSEKNSPKTSQGSVCPHCGQRAHNDVMAYPGHSALFRNRTVARCVDCGLVYMYPMASTAMLNNYYNSGTFWGHVSDKTPFDIPTYHHQAKARVEFIKTRMTFGDKTNILDIGAGYGVLQTYLQKMLPGEVQCFAVEPDQKAQDSLEKINVRWAHVLEAFSGTRFDLIILSHVFEHINDPIGYLKALRDYCRPGTRLFIEVPNEDFRFKFDLEPHVLFFSAETLGAIIRAAGFTVESVETCGLLQTEQRTLNESIRFRNEWFSRIPFKAMLKKWKNLLMKASGTAPSNDPLSAPDQLKCEVYGEGRVWIRCLATLATE